MANFNKNSSYLVENKWLPAMDLTHLSPSRKNFGENADKNKIEDVTAVAPLL